MFNPKNSIGMTLIECMFALLLSSFIISAIFEMYFLAEKSRLSQRNVISLQENAAVLTQVIKEYFRKTGYTGCTKLTADFPFENPLAKTVSLKNKIKLYTQVDVKPGTDAIQITYFSTLSASLIKNMHETTYLYATTTLPVAIDDELVISDCQSAETFRVKAVILHRDGTQNIIPIQPLAKLYAKNAALHKLETPIFLISRAEKKTEYGFYMKNNAGEKIELVPGVDAMHISYTNLEEGELIEHPLTALLDATAIKSLVFNFTLHAGLLHKPWYVYVMLP